MNTSRLNVLHSRVSICVCTYKCKTFSNSGSNIWGKMVLGWSPFAPKMPLPALLEAPHVYVYTHVSSVWLHTAVPLSCPVKTVAAGLLKRNDMYGRLGGPSPSRRGIIIHCNMCLRCDDRGISWSSTSLAVPKVPVEIPQADVIHHCWQYDKRCHAGVLCTCNGTM